MASDKCPMSKHNVHKNISYQISKYQCNIIPQNLNLGKIHSKEDNAEQLRGNLAVCVGGVTLSTGHQICAATLMKYF